MKNLCNSKGFSGLLKYNGKNRANNEMFHKVYSF